MRAGTGVFLMVLLGFAAPALASGGGGHGFALKEHGFYVINFVIFLGIVVLFARKPIGKGLRERAEAFSRRLDGARLKYEETQARLADAQQKTDGLEAEKAGLLQRMREDALRQKETIAEKTLAEGKKIRATTSNALDNEKNRLDRRFRADLALASLGRAEELVAEQWKSLPHGAYVEQFAEALGEQSTTDGGL